MIIFAKDGNAFLFAVQKPDFKMMMLLVAGGGNINQQDVKGISALMLAARIPNVSIDVALIKLGGDPNLKGHSGFLDWTPWSSLNEGL